MVQNLVKHVCLYCPIIRINVIKCVILPCLVTVKIYKTFILNTQRLVPMMTNMIIINLSMFPTYLFLLRLLSRL